ncbi:permease-like cell division protein FtsX [Neptunomonas sp. XY-337]|uniref:permease-like cell division protein FtsX n=1 Tax=Neptunomonas sp. XY-337 TaxID=2561897 RepID=UPI0010A9BC03|nr:permease-like cell division protein FtsX [Neptunomonas sp. XY-337]
MDKKRGAVRVQPTPKPVVEPKGPRGAEHHHIDRKGHSDNWRRHHVDVCKGALRKLLTTPVASAMTIAVLAIALTLPGFLFSALDNMRTIATGWEGETRISLYLQPSLSDADADRFGRQLMLRDDIAAIDMISREQGLREFARISGFSDVLDTLSDNPLPAVVVLMPTATSTKDLGLLRASFEALPEVDEAVLDMEWLQRLQAIMGLASRAVYVLGVLLGLTVLLVIGNTIRVAIESRRDEIVVSKLVGATDAWVRRPFLYTGFWYGLIAALVAWVSIQAAWLMLEQPVEQLAQLYRSHYQLQGLGLMGSLWLFVCSVLLGWAGAGLAVHRHLRDIEPQ